MRIVEFRDDPRLLPSLDLIGRVIAQIDQSGKWVEVLGPEGLHESATAST